jgi:hypothetical protein
MPESAHLVAIAAHGLAGSRTDLPGSPLTSAEWFDLVQTCLAADLIGLLGAAAAAGDLPVTPEQADEVAVVAAERAGLSRLVESRAVTLASVLAAAGIEHRVVDGPARRLAYGDAALRPVHDVRILVPAHRLEHARSLQGPAPVSTGGGPVRRHERVTLRSSLPGLSPVPGSSGNGHAAEADGPGADDDLLERLGPGAVVEAADRRVAVLDLAQQLIATCAALHAAPTTPPIGLRDVVELTLAEGIDARRVRRLAGATGATDALAALITTAWGTFDLADKTELSVWALRVSGGTFARPGGHLAAPAPRPRLARRVLRMRTDPSPEPASGVRPVVGSPARTAAAPGAPPPAGQPLTAWRPR